MKRRISELSKSEIDRACDLHKKAIVINALDSTDLFMYEKLSYPVRLKEAGCTAINVTIPGVGSGFVQSMKDVVRWYSALNKYSSFLTQALSAEDIRKAKKDGKVGLIFGTQNTKCIEDDAASLELFHRLGFRILQLTYQLKNYVGDGCGEKRDSGLSRFGQDVVAEMNSLGMLIDLSHVGPVTTMETIELSKDPVAITHTGAHAIAGTIRTQKDETIKALAEKGGVMGQGAFSLLVKKNPSVTRPTVEGFLDHIDYVVDLVGVDHIGIGLDISEGQPMEHYEGVKRSFPELREGMTPETWVAQGLSSISNLPNITKGLVARGYFDQEILKILGENFLNLFERVWK